MMKRTNEDTQQPTNHQQNPSQKELIHIKTQSDLDDAFQRYNTPVDVNAFPARFILDEALTHVKVSVGHFRGTWATFWSAFSKSCVSELTFHNLRIHRDVDIFLGALASMKHGLEAIHLDEVAADRDEYWEEMITGICRISSVKNFTAKLLTAMPPVVQAISNAIHNNTTLRSLKFGSNVRSSWDGSEEEFKVLAEAIAQNSTLLSLALPGTSSENFNRIVSGISQNKSLQNIEIGTTQFNRNNVTPIKLLLESTTRLISFGISVGWEGREDLLRPLFSSFRLNSSITSITLASEFQVSPDCFSVLVESLFVNKTLKFLNLEKMFFIDCDLHICEFLKKNTSLVFLKLGTCSPVRDSFWEKIGEGISWNSTLKFLEFKNGGPFPPNFSDCFKKNNSLVECPKMGMEPFLNCNKTIQKLQGWPSSHFLFPRKFQRLFLEIALSSPQIPTEVLGIIFEKILIIMEKEKAGRNFQRKLEGREMEEEEEEVEVGMDVDKGESETASEEETQKVPDEKNNEKEQQNDENTEAKPKSPELAKKCRHKKKKHKTKQKA